MRRMIALAAVLSLIGCSGSSSTGTGSGSSTGGTSGTSSSGSTTGTSSTAGSGSTSGGTSGGNSLTGPLGFAVATGVLFGTASDGGVDTANFNASAFDQTVTCQQVFAGPFAARELDISIASSAGVSPGTYPVVLSRIALAQAATDGGGAFVLYGNDLPDGGSEDDHVAISGSVTVTSASTSNLQGTLAVTMAYLTDGGDQSSLSGSFQFGQPVCTF